MRGDNRSETKEGLALREREGTSFPCRSHPNAPQAKPVSLGSIKSTGGVESSSGTIQRFVVKTRRIRRIAPRDPSSTDITTAKVSELGPEVDSTSNEDEFESRIRVKSRDMERRMNDVSNNGHSDEDSLGEKDSDCDPLENGPLDDDSADVNHNKREATSGASNHGSNDGSGAGKSYDWFDECEREEEQWDLNENGIGDDPWTDDEDGEGGDLSDAAKFMSSIRKCAKMTEREDRYRSRDNASGCRSNTSTSNYAGNGSSDHITKDDSYYCCKGATVKSTRYSGGGGEAFDRHYLKHYSDSRSTIPKTDSSSSNFDADDDEGPSGSILRHSISDNTETVLPIQQPYCTGTRSHKNTNNNLCYGAEGSNSTKLHNQKDQNVLLCGRHVGDISHSSSRKEDTEWRRKDTTGTRTNTTDKSHVCDHSEELDTDKVVSYTAGGKIKGDELPEHMLRRRNHNNDDRTENDLTAGDNRISSTKVLQSLDKQNRYKATSIETTKSSSLDNAKQGPEDGYSSGHWDLSPSTSPVTSYRATSSSCTAHSLPKTVTFAKRVKSADDESGDDEDVDETDEDAYDSQGDSSSVSDKGLSSSRRSGGSKVAGDPYKNNRTKRGVVSIVKHQTVSTADLDSDGPPPPPLQQRPQHGSVPSFHYLGAPPVFTHHLHPPGVTHPGGSAIGSATSKRRYLSLPLLEQDCSEVDSCSSTDISPGDSSGPSGGTSVPVYPGTRLLNPGEVYYFAPNSCVVCVERSKLTPTRIQVTPPKSAGLNPNANVFQSKGATTPPEVTNTGGSNNSPDWQENTDQLNNVITPEGYTFMNGDVTNLPAAGVTFPPTPESPNTMQITATSTPDYTSLNGALMPNEILFSGSEAGDESTGVLGNIPEDQLRDMLKNQLEYYFSRENLANDSYLVSQMDADQYVPISTVAGFNQVKRMTTNMDLVIEVLRESPNVQVDETGEKVRPLHKRCVVILREVPDTTPIEDVEKLFSGQNCPRFVSCEFAHNNSWYITFDSDEDAQKAYQYLREEVQTFLGKPIMARIKAKPLLRSTFIPKNGYKAGMAPTGPGQASPAVVSQTATTPTPTFSPTDNQFAAAQQQYTFTQAVPNVPQTTQFIVGQPQPQQQTGTQQQPTATVTSYPFFPPNNAAAAAAAVMHSWPGNPMPYFDPGTAFAANGYTHAATFKVNNTQSRHGFQNMRNRTQTKPHITRQNSGPERQTSQEGAPSTRSHHDTRNTSSHERHQPVSSVSRSSSRGSDIGHPTTVSRRERGSSSNVDQTHSSVSSSGGGVSSHSTPYSAVSTVHSHASPATVGTSSAAVTAENSHAGTTSVTSSASQSVQSRQTVMAGGDSSLKDPASQQPPRRSSYRSRRRRDDDGAKTSSRGSTQASAKDTKTSLESPKFDLEATSFPPLPGSTNSTTTGDIFENKMSDVVKGTAKPSTTKPTQLSTTTSSKEATPTPTATPTSTSSSSQSQSQPKSSQSIATTTVAKATSTTVMATSTSSSSNTSQPTAAAVVAASSKGTSVSNASTVNSLPTPPPTPPSQPSKSEASSVSASNKKQSEEKKETTSSATAPASSASKQEKELAPAAGGMPKLTYAQMLQRKAAMNEAAANAAAANGEASKDSNGNNSPPANGSSAPAMNGLPPSSGTSTNTTSTSNSVGKPAALREQLQTSRGSGTSRNSDPFRKDDNGYKDQRMGGFRGDPRRAKENRDRRDFRDRDFRDRGFRDRDTDRYRRDSDRYRDERRRDYDPVRTSTK